MNNLSINTLKQNYDTLTELFLNKKDSLTALEIDMYKTRLKDLRKSIFQFEITPTDLYKMRRIIARSCGVDEKILLSKTSVENIVIARIYYAYFARLLTEYSLNEIGAPINKDHTMVLYYLKQYPERIEYDKKFRVFRNAVIGGLSLDFPGILEQLQEQIV